MEGNSNSDDPGLKTFTVEQQAYIEKLVDQRVSERVGEMRGHLQSIDSKIADMEDLIPGDKGTIILFSGEMDLMLAAFIIATGAASMGTEVSMFFPFWGISALRKSTIYSGKPITEKMMGLMLPSGPASLATSRMNMLGMGPIFFKYMMKKKQVEALPDLIDMARELEVRFIACEMSMNVMGVTKDELIDGVELGGVAVCMCEATDSRFTIFV